MLYLHPFALLFFYYADFVCVVVSLSPSLRCDKQENAVRVQPRALALAEDKFDQKGQRPLHGAAVRCHEEIVQLLFDYGADPMLVDANGNTALHLAAGCPNVTRALVQYCDVNAINSENATALHLAVRALDIASVKTLLSFGALTNLTDRRQRTALDEAVATRNQSIVALFKTNETEAQPSNWFRLDATTTAPTTQLYSTTQKTLANTEASAIFTTKRPKPARVILKRPAGKEKEFIKAASKGFEGIIVDFCADGMNPNFADVTDNNTTPLHEASRAGEYLTIVTLIACGAMVDSIDREGNTPLHLTALRNDSWSSAVLLFLGANPHISQRMGKTAYQIAKESKEVGMGSVFDDRLLAWYENVRKLEGLEKDLHHYVRMGRYASGVAKQCIAGVDVNMKDAGNKDRTALHVAASINVNVVQMIQTLMRCGADVNARDAEGNTPLHIAVMEGKDQAFTSLLLYRADPFMPNHKGKTAQDLAAESKSDFIKWTSVFGVHRYHWYRTNKFM